MQHLIFVALARVVWTTARWAKDASDDPALEQRIETFVIGTSLGSAVTELANLLRWSYDPSMTPGHPNELNEACIWGGGVPGGCSPNLKPCCRVQSLRWKSPNPTPPPTIVPTHGHSRGVSLHSQP
eukprot:c18144_g1_i3.p3 GENE.c18144_g1_i3~~c18144_g1_i3.p3  ORF type:complete len:126 (+),score=12.93 c18144_g1_i3:399-776(+)